MISLYLCLIVMTLMGSVASLFLKKAASSENFRETLMNPNLYVGAIIYILSAFLNIWILRRMDYSSVLPLTSLTYVWTMVLSFLVLKEKITVKKGAGVSFIVLGAVLVSLA